MQTHTRPLALAAACILAVGAVTWRLGADSAESITRAEPTSVAIVNIERALNSLKELEARNKALADRVAGRQAELDALNKERESLQGQLELLSESDTERRREVRARMFVVQETAKARASAFQSLINIERGEIIRPLYLKLSAAVSEIATKQGYDIVLFDDRSMEIPVDVDRVVNQAIQQKRILYAADRVDITDQIILLLNQKFEAGVE